uniref:Helicase domino n=1 Tax=Zeugodacus cucurbitae TaxID=28588 RepID=A0A0A1XKR5_ZEUCU
MWKTEPKYQYLDRKTSMIMRKIETFKNKMENLSLELTIKNYQLSYLQSLYNDIQKMKNKLDFNEEIEIIYDQIGDEFFQELCYFNRQSQQEEPKNTFRSNLDKEEFIIIPKFSSSTTTKLVKTKPIQKEKEELINIPNLKNKLNLSPNLSSEVERTKFVKTSDSEEEEFIIVPDLNLFSKTKKRPTKLVEDKKVEEEDFIILPKFSLSSANELVKKTKVQEEANKIEKEETPEHPTSEEKSTEVVGTSDGDIHKIKNETGDQEVESNILANEQITWHFSPPADPHFGEMWKAGVTDQTCKLSTLLKCGDTNYCTTTFEDITSINIQIYKMQSDINPKLDPIVKTIKEIAGDQLTTLQISKLEQRKLREGLEKISNNELKLILFNIYKIYTVH